MRHWGVAVYLAGFASGVLFLAVLLWRTNAQQSIKASSNPPPVSSRAAANAVSRSNLLIPVQGVAPRDLRDNFLDARAGHVHEALDIDAPRGTPVLATADGELVKLFNSKAGGLTIYQFDESRNWCFYYAHLDRYAPELAEGVLLRKGDVIGYVGTTGNAPANAPHLHFTIFKLGPEKQWWKGTVLNPYPFLSAQLNRWPPE